MKQSRNFDCDGKFEVCGLRKENACVKQTSFLWSVPGFEPRALGLVAQIVTGQYTEYSDKTAL